MTTEIKPEKLLHHYSLYVDRSDAPATCEILCNLTQEVVASLPFGDDANASEETIRLLIQALDRFLRHDGQFSVTSLRNSLRAIAKRYSQSEVTEVTTRRFSHDPINGKQIIYHAGLEDQFDVWAELCRMEPQSLKQATKTAIRERHHEATLPHPADYAQDGQPNVWHLAISGFEVIYTVEPDRIVVRGYGYEYDEETDDGGGHYCDYRWSQSADERRQS